MCLLFASWITLCKTLYVLFGSLYVIFGNECICTATKDSSTVKMVCCCQAVWLRKYFSITATNGGKTAVTLSQLKMVRRECCQYHKAFATILRHHCHNTAASLQGLGAKNVDNSIASGRNIRVYKVEILANLSHLSFIFNCYTSRSYCLYFKFQLYWSSS